MLRLAQNDKTRRSPWGVLERVLLDEGAYWDGDKTLRGEPDARQGGNGDCGGLCGMGL